jgi:hypothetical protein
VVFNGLEKTASSILTFVLKMKAVGSLETSLRFNHTKQPFFYDFLNAIKLCYVLQFVSSDKSKQIRKFRPRISI